MSAGCRVDQLPGDAHPVAGLAHAAFEHVAHAELLRHLLHGDRLALVGEGRVARDDEEPRQPRDCGRDLLDHAIDEILLLGIAGQVLKRQDHERRLVGERQNRCFASRRLRRLAADARDEHPHRPRDVLQALLADIVKFDIDLASHLAEYVL